MKNAQALDQFLTIALFVLSIATIVLFFVFPSTESLLCCLVQQMLCLVYFFERMARLFNSNTQTI